MRNTSEYPDRVHLIAHANPLAPDLARFGFTSVADYLCFIRTQLPAPLRLACSQRLLEAREDEWQGGRTDDRERIRALQDALDDPHTLAVVAASGGAYFTRLLPHLDFTVLRRRRAPLWALGFSEMTTLVNIAASYRGGRGLYWLCPNYLGWRIRPTRAARAAFGEFWRVLPALLAERTPSRSEHLHFGPIRGRLVRGRVTEGPIRVIGGCLAVLAAVVAGPWFRRLRPDGRWLLLEDINEQPYRIDRHLAALKVAGWFERVAGVLVGDFRLARADIQPAVLALLKYHLPRGADTPVVVTRSVGHVWPMVPVELNRPLLLNLHGRRVSIGPLSDRFQSID